MSEAPCVWAGAPFRRRYSLFRILFPPDSLQHSSGGVARLVLQAATALSAREPAELVRRCSHISCFGRIYPRPPLFFLVISVCARPVPATRIHKQRNQYATLRNTSRRSPLSSSSSPSAAVAAASLPRRVIPLLISAQRNATRHFSLAGIIRHWRGNKMRLLRRDSAGSRSSAVTLPRLAFPAHCRGRFV